MKTGIITFTLVLLYSSNIWAHKKEICLKSEDIPAEVDQFKSPIPVRVNLDNTLLGIHFFKKAEQVFVTVTGPDGVLYQREITSETSKSIYIDLAKYQSGEYSIHFQDAEGNEVSGEFFKEE